MISFRELIKISKYPFSMHLSVLKLTFIITFVRVSEHSVSMELIIYPHSIINRLITEYMNPRSMLLSIPKMTGICSLIFETLYTKTMLLIIQPASLVYTIIKPHFANTLPDIHYPLTIILGSISPNKYSLSMSLFIIKLSCVN